MDANGNFLLPLPLITSLFLSDPSVTDILISSLGHGNMVGSHYSVYIPLTNQVRGPYRKINRRVKRGSVTYGKDREDKVSKIFIISLLCV